MTIADFRAALLVQCKRIYQNAIYAVYAPHTQVNIVAGIEGDLAAFRKYIAGQQAEFSELKTAIANLKDTAIHEKFAPQSDERMLAYIGDFLPSLTTDAQKMAIIVALQSVRG